MELHKVSPELLEKLKAIEKKSPRMQQLELTKKLAADIKAITQLATKFDNGPILKQINQTLTDTAKCLEEFTKKEPPQTDLTPFTDRVAELAAAMAKVKQEVKVAAPKVSVLPAPVTVSLEEVAEAIAGLKKAFKVTFPKTLGQDVSKVFYGNQELIPEHLPIDTFQRGQTVVVEGSKGTVIRVLSCFVMAGQPVSMRFLSGDTPVSGFIELLPTTGFVLPRNEDGWMEASSDLVIQTDRDATLGGMITIIRRKTDG